MVRSDRLQNRPARKFISSTVYSYDINVIEYCQLFFMIYRVYKQMPNWTTIKVNFIHVTICFPTNYIWQFICSIYKMRYWCKGHTANESRFVTWVFFFEICIQQIILTERLTNVHSSVFFCGCTFINSTPQWRFDTNYIAMYFTSVHQNELQSINFNLVHQNEHEIINFNLGHQNEL